MLDAMVLNGQGTVVVQLKKRKGEEHWRLLPLVGVDRRNEINVWPVRVMAKAVAQAVKPGRTLVTYRQIAVIVFPNDIYRARRHEQWPGVQKAPLGTQGPVLGLVGKERKRATRTKRRDATVAAPVRKGNS